jgi:hypothetical protein
LIAACVLMGCGRARPPAVGEAQRAVRIYYKALLRREWPRAYAALHPDSQARCRAEQFTQLAEGYLRRLGFEPDGARVWACEEHGAEAVAHVVVTGQSAAGPRRYKDAVVLRRGEGGWGAVLPAHFGQRR